MFKNRSVNLKVVKDEDPTPINQIIQTNAVRTIAYNDFVRSTAKATILVVGFYMASSTVRSVLVHVVATKIQ